VAASYGLSNATESEPADSTGIAPPKTAAKAAGMHTIAVTNTHDAAQLKQADKVVARLDELTMDDLRRICS
jgi:hypothetical protein